MKACITQTELFPTSLDALKQVVQVLWDEMDPMWYADRLGQVLDKP